MLWSNIAEKMPPWKPLLRNALIGNAPLAPVSYGMTLLVGSLVGFGLLVSLPTPHALNSVASVQTLPISSPAKTEHPAAPPHTLPAAAEHEAKPADAHGHSHHEIDPLEKERAKMRQTFTDTFISRFLSTDCAKNRHSETGIQFGPDSYTEYTNSKITRYVKGEYEFDTNGFKLISDETHRFDFNMSEDTLSLAGIMVSGVLVPTSGELKWQACRSTPHILPEQAPTPTRLEPADGLRLALSAKDQEAAVYFLALGAYIPASELANIAKTPGFEGVITSQIRGASKLNEEDSQHRKTEDDTLEERRRIEAAKHPKTAKPTAAGKEAEKPKAATAHH